MVLMFIFEFVCGFCLRHVCFQLRVVRLCMTMLVWGGGRRMAGGDELVPAYLDTRFGSQASQSYVGASPCGFGMCFRLVDPEK